MDRNPDRGTRDIQSIGGFFGSSDRKKQISPDTILSAIANEYRRAILTVLDDACEETLEYEMLVDRILDEVRDDNAGRVPDEQRQRVRISLHHTHLPILDEARIIDYEAETRHIQFAGGELEREILALVESYDASE